ncbi:hypothetical protein SAY87_000948 [Trapa incisa]|uniref:Uncharacterized protein n=1 Tax=Trapa incisa TaxID=236973 RepID=A0AAN7GUK5_9MYRT|nr:hypothetical protein SAY87_000948 [Trapa incisa]
MQRVSQPVRWWRRSGSGNISLFSRIFEILSADSGPDNSASDHALLLNLPLSESFVLDVLLDGRRRLSGVLLCLKFFDWAGRQPRFYHPRATFHAMFKILSMNKPESHMMDFFGGCWEECLQVEISRYIGGELCIGREVGCCPPPVW